MRSAQRDVIAELPDDIPAVGPCLSDTEQRLNIIGRILILLSRTLAEIRRLQSTIRSAP